MLSRPHVACKNKVRLEKTWYSSHLATSFFQPAPFKPTRIKHQSERWEIGGFLPWITNWLLGRLYQVRCRLVIASDHRAISSSARLNLILFSRRGIKLGHDKRCSTCGNNSWSRCSGSSSAVPTAEAPADKPCETEKVGWGPIRLFSL